MTIDAQDLPAFVIDFEATDATTDAQATEIGYCAVAFSAKGVLNPLHHPQAMLCKPDRPISYGAMAVTGICPEDIADKPSHTQVVSYYMPVGAAYIIAHNADYDIQVAANAGVDVSQYKRICTQALARRLLPDLDSHSLGALTYAINPDLARQYCRNAHDAGYDVNFTLWLLEHLCELGGIANMQDLHNASEKARIPLTFTFGKHKGKAISDVARQDKGYLHWLIRNSEDSYLLTALKNALVSNGGDCER